MRDAIWKASDAMNHAVQDVPSVGVREYNPCIAARTFLGTNYFEFVSIASFLTLGKGNDLRIT